MHHTILIYFSFKYIDSHCARLKNVHHDFMKVIKNWIAFLWAPQKCAPRFYKGHKKCIAFVWASQKCASPFYEGLQKLPPFLWVFQRCASRFMKVLKNASPLHEHLNNAHHGFLWRPFKMRISFLWVFQNFASWYMKVIKKCFSFVWALQQCATRFYEGLKNTHVLFSVSFKNLHHNLWRSQKLHLLCTALQ